MKSERLKKLEAELRDLEQWLKLGLVPKKDVVRHQEEIHQLKGRIEEEKERLQFLKENGEGEEYITPRRNPGRAAYPDTPSMTDMDMGEEPSNMTDAGLDLETEAMDFETTVEEDRGGAGGAAAAEEEGEEDAAEEDEEDEDPFSDRNRWRRGIMDPDSDDW